MHTILTNLFVMNESWYEKTIRSFAVYLFLLIAFRIAGKREIGQVSNTDLLVLLLISNTVQNAIIGDDLTLIGGVYGAVVLILLNKALDRFEYLSPKFRTLVDGEPVHLIVDGQIQENTMKAQSIDPNDIRGAARAQGVNGLEDILHAVLETNGSISIIPRVTGNDLELELRLDRIEHMLRELTRPHESNGANA
jgi:uncharacterized membrane protein YcaP (DUF421 family)